MRMLYKMYRYVVRSYFQYISIIKLKMMHVEFAPDIIIRGKSTLLLRGNVKIGKRFTLQSGPLYSFDGGSRCKIDVANDAKLEIGDYSGISNTTLSCKKEIRIGNYVNIGGQCIIMDSNHHSLEWEDRMDHIKDKTNTKTAPIIIGDYVFIGARCLLCKGVTIGEKSIVAAGSVVVTDIPSGEIWGGNPARFIKKID